MTDFNITELGKIEETKHHENGKTFLHDLLNLTSCEVSINSVPQGFKLPFSHKHKQNEELYIFLKGSGKMFLNGKEFTVKEGSCVRVTPAVSRTLENTGDADMQFICIQAKADSLEQFGLSDAEIC